MRTRPHRSVLPFTIQPSSGDGKSRPNLTETQPVTRTSASRPTSHPGQRMARIIAPEPSSAQPAAGAAGRPRAGSRARMTAVETFTAEEPAALTPYFTELDGPVLALVNLPQALTGPPLPPSSPP